MHRPTFTSTKMLTIPTGTAAHPGPVAKHLVPAFPHFAEAVLAHVTLYEGVPEFGTRPDATVAQNARDRNAGPALAQIRSHIAFEAIAQVPFFARLRCRSVAVLTAFQYEL